MRKLLIVALAALTSIALASVAIAQSPDITQTLTLSPSGAGTKSKPRATKLKTRITNNLPGTTAEFIEILFPSTVKLSTRGLTACPVAEFLKPGGKANCKSASKAGSGEANALTGPQRVPVRFAVTAYVGGPNLVVFYIEQGGIKRALRGTISRTSGKFRQKLSIEIPDDLQQTAGNYSSLVNLESTLFNKKGKNSLVSSTGCKRKKQTLGSRLVLVDNPGPPPKLSATGSATAGPSPFLGLD